MESLDFSINLKAPEKDSVTNLEFQNQGND